MAHDNMENFFLVIGGALLLGGIGLSGFAINKKRKDKARTGRSLPEAVIRGTRPRTMEMTEDELYEEGKEEVMAYRGPSQTVFGGPAETQASTEDLATGRTKPAENGAVGIEVEQEPESAFFEKETGQQQKGAKVRNDENKEVEQGPRPVF